MQTDIHPKTRSMKKTTGEVGIWYRSTTPAIWVLSLCREQLPEVTRCPAAAACDHTNDCLKAQPLQALWFGAQSSSGAAKKPWVIFPCGVASSLLSGKMGAALGLVGRCRGSTQLGKPAVARFQAWHGSPGTGQNRCETWKRQLFHG